jgi:hypothetical protein
MLLTPLGLAVNVILPSFPLVALLPTRYTESYVGNTLVCSTIADDFTRAA